MRRTLLFSRDGRQQNSKVRLRRGQAGAGTGTTCGLDCNPVGQNTHHLEVKHLICRKTNPFCTVSYLLKLTEVKPL